MITSSTRTRRGGSCLRFDYKTFFIYRTCARRAPCVLALHELVALLLSKNVTGLRPRCNATSSEHFLHTSHCTLHTLHFTLHTCTSHSTAHLISNHLISFRLMSPHLTSSHLIPSLLTYHLSKFFSTIFMSSEHWKNHLNQSQLRCTLESSHRQSLHKVLPGTTSCYKACTKQVPVLLCATILHNVLPSTTLYYKATAIHDGQLQKTIVLRTQP